MLKQWNVSAGVLISFGLFGMSQVACSVLLISLACLSSRAHSKSPSVLKHEATSPNVESGDGGWNMLSQWDVSAGVLISYDLLGMSQLPCSLCRHTVFLQICLACLSRRAHFS